MRKKIRLCIPSSKYRHFNLSLAKSFPCLYTEDFCGTRLCAYVAASPKSRAVAVLSARTSPLPRDFCAPGHEVNDKACTLNACCNVRQRCCLIHLNWLLKQLGSWLFLQQNLSLCFLVELYPLQPSSC